MAHGLGAPLGRPCFGIVHARHSSASEPRGHGAWRWIECAMRDASDAVKIPPSLRAALLVATAVAFSLRAWDITGQVVMDDEWHAIHKLISAGYGGVFNTFGLADHSIPLTLFYKAMADTSGLTEGRMRALQIAFGTALVPIAAWVAWRATRDAAATALFAFLLSASPFLVYWSRYARPYAITLTLTVVCLAALWEWRAARSPRLAGWVVACAAFATWLHAISILFPATAWSFVFVEAMAAPAPLRGGAVRSALRLGLQMALAILVLLAVPLHHDLRSLLGKAGGDHANFATFDRMISIFWGGLPAAATAGACALSAAGAITLWRRNARMVAYLGFVALAPVAALTVVGAAWIQEGQTFARYVLPVQVILMLLASIGTTSLARLIYRPVPEGAAWLAASLFSAAYLLAVPTVGYVVALGPWFGHTDYHWDYRYRWNFAKRHDAAYSPPQFYLKLGRMPAGTAPIIEAPFSFAAPFNDLAYYATFHRQPETLGMLHDLCLEGPRQGEPPAHDPRFRFRKFIFLDDVQAVHSSGARYLLLLRDSVNGRPFREFPVCLEKLTRLYGKPVSVDSRVAVFDLEPGEPPPKLQ